MKNNEKIVKENIKIIKKTLQITKATAKITAKSIKATVKTTINSIKAVATGTKAVTTAIIAGGWADHVGIVTRMDIDNRIIYTIEGNTDNQCAERKYSFDDKQVMGYGSPKY